MIYLDYNATTPLCHAARDAMLPYLDRHFGNPSSVHAAGRETRAAVDNARDKLAALLRAKPNEFVFTSGGTESCNLAVFGLARSHREQGGHVISAKTEHHAVLNAVEHLENHEGFEVTWLNVSHDGVIDLDQLADAIRTETRLVSIMTANNETGVIQPMREISKICRERGVLLHSDMVQSFGKIETDLSLVDAASFAAHKFYGPKAQDFCFCAAVCQSSRSCSVALTRTNDGPERKTWLRSLAWLQLPNGRCRIASKNSTGKHGCATSFGPELRKMFQRRSKTEQVRLGWRIR